MRFARLAIAIALPAALAFVSFVSLTGSAVAYSDQPERSIALPFGNGEGLALASRKLAVDGEDSSVVVAFASAAVTRSPLYFEPFFAASRAVDRPDLAAAVLFHAHVLSRHDRKMLQSMAAILLRDGDGAGAIDMLDQMFRLRAEPDAQFATVADLIADPAARARAAELFAQPRSWGGRFLMQIDPTPQQAQSVRLLVADMRRRGTPLPDATLAPLVQRLSYGDKAQQAEGWRIWSTRSGANPLAWPPADGVASMPYSWWVPEDLADRVTFGDGALRYELEGIGATVAKVTAALPAGQYRLQIAGADPRVQLLVACGGDHMPFASGATVEIAATCPIQTLGVQTPGGSGRVGAIQLTAIR